MEVQCVAVGVPDAHWSRATTAPAKVPSILRAASSILSWDLSHHPRKQRLWLKVPIARVCTTAKLWNLFQLYWMITAMVLVELSSQSMYLCLYLTGCYSQHSSNRLGLPHRRDPWTCTTRFAPRYLTILDEGPSKLGSYARTLCCASRTRSCA